MASVPGITLKLGRQRKALMQLLRMIKVSGSYSEDERKEVARLRTSINNIKSEMRRTGLDPKQAVAAARKATIKAQKQRALNLRSGGAGVYAIGSTKKFWS